MEIFTCKYENHENEAIIGFCLNSMCQNPSQYCYKCLMKVHSDHQDSCIRFINLSDLINQYISFEGEMVLQSNEIFNTIKNQIQSNIKRMEDNISTLKNLNQLLKAQEYLKFKQLLNIVKQYYSIEQQKKEVSFINQLNEFQEIIKLKENKFENQQEVEKIFEMAKQLANERKHEDALKLYDKLLSLQNMKDDVFRWKGQSLFYLKRIEEGIQCCDMAIKLNPKNDMAHNNKGWALEELKQYKEAIVCFDKAIELNSKNDSAHTNKGWALNQLKQYKEAVVCFDKAIELNPKNDFAYNNKGQALRNLNQFKEAIICFDKAIELNPKNDNAYHTKAYALHQMKEYQKAIEFYDKALSLSQNAIFFLNKAETLLALRKKEEAKKCYQNALNAGYADKDYIKKQLKKL